MSMAKVVKVERSKVLCDMLSIFYKFYIFYIVYTKMLENVGKKFWSNINSILDDNILKI